MVLSDIGVDMNSYDFKMITKNTISALLPATASKKDNITQIYYKITSKQSLENIYNCSKISGRELLMVIKSIVSNAKNVELYLLDLDYLIIKFEYLYLDLNDYKTYICYYPGEKNSFYESLLQFVQKLLTVTDHTDQMATKLIYGIYEICNKKNYLLSDIEKYLKVYDELTFMENKYYDSGCDKEIIRDDYYDHEIDIKSTNIDKSKKIVNRIKEIFVHPGEKDTKDSYMANKSDLNKPEPLFNSSPPISYNNISYDHESTILLDEDIEKSPHILTGICGCENIAISKFPVVIGKVSEKVD